MIQSGGLLKIASWSITKNWIAFNEKPGYLRDLSILIISSISSFDIISVVVPEPKIFLCIPASAADTAVGNPNGIKTLLANDLNTFFIKINPVFSNGPRSNF